MNPVEMGSPLTCEASVSLDSLCKVTLTAPCSTLMDLLDNSKTFVCIGLTWDHIRPNARIGQTINLFKLFRVDRSFHVSSLIAPTINSNIAGSSLPTDIFQFIPNDPYLDDELITMAMIYEFCCVAKVDAITAGILEQSMKLSKQFAKNFCYNALLRSTMRSYSSEYAECDKLILIKLIPTKKHSIDLKWSYRLMHLLWKRLQLEDTMNWLNTLGGGYSALGDYYEFHANKAGKISCAQLGVALDMGDPPIVIRCHLFYALSIMQRGRLREAKYCIRYLYSASIPYHKTDHRLKNMCLGVWSKLQHYYRLRKTRTTTNGITHDIK